MQKHGWIVGSSLAIGLGLCAFLAAGARAQEKEVRLGEYWIGVQVQHPMPDLVRAQLSIPKDEGVMVEEVEPSTPAQGKLQKYDVIVKAGTKPLRSVADLVGAVDAVKGGKLTLEVLRGGKTLQVELAPVKRPAEVRAKPQADVLMVAPEMSYKALNKVLEEWRNRNLGERTLRIETMRPGWILLPGTPHQPPLPGNLTISVTKQGDQPAKIVVQRDDQKWEVTENELDKLPKDLRPHVERMLGHGLGWPMAEFLQQGHKLEVFPHVGPKGGTLNVLPHVEPTGAPKPHAERQIDEMRQQIDQLRKLLDELQAQVAAPKAEAPK